MIGVYKLSCTANNKSYIGAAVFVKDDPLFFEKPLRSDLHPIMSLQADYTIYGSNAFNVELLHEFDPKRVNTFMINKFVSFFIEKLSPEYNQDKNKKKTFKIGNTSVSSYSPDQYEGEFNLKRAEKDLIIKAAIVSANQRNTMARKMRISEDKLQRAIISHSLQDVL